MIIVAGLTSVFVVFDAPIKNADTAILMEHVDNAAKHGVPNTLIGLSTLDIFYTWFADFREVCAAPLKPSPPPYNILTFHAYLIDYPLALLVLLAPVEIVVPTAHALAFIGVLAALYFLLRSREVPIIGAILFVGLTAAHPVWAMGLAANLYPDRLFMPFAFIYIWQLHLLLTEPFARTRRRHVAVAVMSAFASITTERAAITIGAVTLVCLVLYWPQLGTWRRRLAIAAYATAPLLLFAAYRQFQDNLYMERVALTPSFIWASLLYALGPQGPYTLKFFVVNFGLFGIFALANWRLAIVAAVALAPNIIITVGGGEKTGFYTHYHAIYFPFLVYATALGFARIVKRLNGRLAREAVLGTLVVAATVVMLYIDPYTPALRFEAWRFSERIFPKVWRFYKARHYAKPSPELQYLTEVASRVPSGATVTTVEGFMPILRPNHRVHYYPLAIDTADYAVLPVDKDSEGKPFFAGAVSYRKQDEQLNKCLGERLRRAGYNVDEPLMLGKHAILKRNPAAVR